MPDDISYRLKQQLSTFSYYAVFGFKAKAFGTAEASSLESLTQPFVAIAPGYMATRVTEALRKDPVRSKAILERIPAGRWGEPDDLRGVVVFLQEFLNS